MTFDCADPWPSPRSGAEALGSNLDEDNTREKAWVRPAGWGGPSLWFQRMPEGKTAENRRHFALRGPSPGQDLPHADS